MPTDWIGYANDSRTWIAALTRTPPHASIQGSKLNLWFR